MKKIIISLVLATIVVASINAQEQKRPSMTPEQRAERYFNKISEELALTSQQKASVKALILAREIQRDELRKQTPNDNAAFMSAFKKVNAQTEKDIKALLTPEQIEKQKQAREATLKRNKENKVKVDNKKPDDVPEKLLSPPPVESGTATPK